MISTVFQVLVLNMLLCGMSSYHEIWQGQNKLNLMVLWQARYNQGKCTYQMHESRTAIAELPLSSCLCEYILVISLKRLASLPGNLLDRLQSVMNDAARLVYM